MAPVRESRLGGSLCGALPWTTGKTVPGPRCRFERACLADGVCWQAKERERQAHAANAKRPVVLQLA